MANYIVLGTWDTKHEELDFICQEIKRQSHQPIPIDLSTKKKMDSREIAVNQSILKAKARLRELEKKKPISGVISVGGGTNLFMATKLMEGIPLFVPKVIISTMIVNSIQQFKPYQDILYIQSPCDFGMLNPITKSILTNAVRMLTSFLGGQPRLDKPAIAITGFGITDGCFKTVKNFWDKKGFYLIPFHSIGENTMAMAELIQMGFFKGILDLTLHDVMDHIVGGAYGKINKNRLYAYLSKDLPAVISPGGLDTIAFPNDHPSLPLFRKRKRYHHDFRWGIKASKEEIIKAVKWIGNILKETHPQKSIFLIPLRGWSYPGEPGREFYDPELIQTFKKGIEKFINEEFVMSVDLSINDSKFGLSACKYLENLLKA
ncbi:MAG: Tm-1-like ATP-binding domain-containing protein [Syntrophaceae bacterium]|nr:Tm-1-like ATP-binding domain-containing protein [Syntrophaceae bacterium]